MTPAEQPAGRPAEQPAELPSELADRAADRLLAGTGPARTAVLAELIAAHPAHEQALRTLCADIGGVEGLLDATYPDPASTLPTQIGGHRVLQRLGEGAFGIVYLCAQERPVVRQVAIKVLRPGAGDPKTLQRFAAERQLLAQLNHPGITQVFDAGELPDGRPFFVMEYVDGTPLHAWCVEHGLACGARLRLFVDVCRAVAHAHARGIVHRDLKPANVLVVATPDGPVPKVIDFGIAKAVGGGAGDDVHPRTEAGRVIGTPGYMSPEQAAGRIDEVDERADVFSLGVMLYELLTDQLPWARTATASETAPLLPSRRVRSTVDGPRAGAPSPRHRLAAELRGDLDWITLKALARERDERYARAADLAADVERHLRGDTVSAGPPSLRYRLRKFARRNRAAVVAAAVVGLLTIGLVITFTRASQFETEAQRARGEAATGLADARGVVAELLLRANDPALFGSAHGDLVRKELCAQAVAFTDRLLVNRSDDPALLGDRCDALQQASQVQSLLGETTRARAAAAEAVRIAEDLFGNAPDDPAARGMLGSALRHEGRAMAMAGDDAGANERLRASVEHLTACAASTPTWRRMLAVATSEMAAALPPARRAEAIAAFHDALATFETLRVDGPTRDATRDEYVTASLGLARTLSDDMQGELAMQWLGRIAPELGSLGPSRLRLTVDFHRLSGAVAWGRGERQSARPHFERAVVAADEFCQKQPRRAAAHHLRIGSLSTLSRILHHLGDIDGSDAVSRRTIDAAEAMVAEFPDDPTARVSLGMRLVEFANLLRDRFRMRDLDEAASCMTRAVEQEALLGATGAQRLPHWRLLTSQVGVEESRGGPDLDRLLREMDALLPDSPLPLDTDRDRQLEGLASLARWHLANDRPAEAARRTAAARGIIGAFPDHRKRLVEVGWVDANLAVRAGDHAAAAAEADRIVAARPTWFGFRRAADCLRLAAVCAKDGDAAPGYRDRAMELYRRTIAELDKDVQENPRDPWYVLPWGLAHVRLAEFAAAAGSTDEARQRLAAALPLLEGVQADAQRDQWDEEGFRAGVALRERLQQ